MPKVPLTNIHIHVFTTECAPDKFLRSLNINFLRRFPGPVKKIIDYKRTRSLIDWLAKFGKSKKGEERSKISKYISFLEVGTSREQIDIFRDALEVGQKFDTESRMIGLSLNMDHMDDTGQPPKNFNTQLRELKRIKKYYPDHFFPFVCVDPRARSGQMMVNWIKKFFENGLRSKDSKQVYPFFAGIKMYPALGFFPFDPRLDQLYAYAEKNGIPIMTHCTRVGSQYIGARIESLIPKKAEMLGPEAGTSDEFDQVKKEIHDRIDRYYAMGWVKNSDIGDNDKACDLFGHPQNYVPVMLKYPKLKICLAHMGGDDQMLLQQMKEEEIRRMKRKKRESIIEELEIIKTDHYNWASLVKDLMKRHPNMYTDISYTLGALGNEKVKKEIAEWLDTKDQKEKPLGDRVLFGTDFYMTEREARESVLYGLAQDHLSDWYDRMSRDNCERYLYEQP